MRPEKESMLAEIRGRVENSVFLILADFTRMSVEQDLALRSKLRAVDGEIHVVRNRMLRHVVRDLDVDGLEDGLKGPTAMVTGSGEAAEIVKVLRDFIKEKDIPVIKMGAMDGVFLSAEQVNQLANLPSRPQLYAMLLGVLQAPARNFVSTLHAGVSQIVNVLAAQQRKLEGA